MLFDRRSLDAFVRLLNVLPFPLPPVLSHYVTTCSFWLWFNCSIKPSWKLDSICSICDKERASKREQKERDDKKESVLLNIRKTESLHVMHSKPSPPLIFPDKLKIFWWRRESIVNFNHEVLSHNSDNLWSYEYVLCMQELVCIIYDE